MTIAAFLAYIGVQWWSSWYPGSEPGGGGYVAQRMLSAKDEKHSLWATLFFQTAHYAIRPWPWILVALAALVIYPELGADEKKLGYVRAINEFLPSGLKGLMIAAFFAAYMSTVATQLNWGTSYLVNDLYKRFLKKSGDEKHYVLMSRVFTLLLMVVSAIVTTFITRISGAWEFIIECGAGLGLVLILRWYWWRINAWSEITAVITPFVLLPFVKMNGISFPESLYFLSGGTTIAWLVVTFLTKPTDELTLRNFYLRIKPGGTLWKPVFNKLSDNEKNHFNTEKLRYNFIGWISGVVLVYSFLFGTGGVLFGFTNLIIICSVTFVLSTGVLIYVLNQRKE
jgi:Na+/proline symporter